MRLTAIILILLTGSIVARSQDAPQFPDLLAANPKLSRWLTVQMREFGGGPLKSYTAHAFLKSQLLWQNGTQAIYYATARPPTEATLEELGVLVAARRDSDGKWRVMKSLRFEAKGIEEAMSAELTSFSHIGAGIPVVTVTLEQGGRESNFSESFTYTMEEDNFILHRPDRPNF
jgi:hypothetical protein